MHKLVSLRKTVPWFAVSLLCIVLSGCFSEKPITIAYQGMANPWKALIKANAFEKHTAKKIAWKKFNSGAKIINAMASGDVDLAVMGSTPLASALGQGLNLKVIWIMSVIGDSEALITRKDTNGFAGLKGAKIGVPFGSTSHYHLMLALKDAEISPKEVEIFNLAPSAIVSSWKTREIDAAYVWAPALEEIKKDGQVLITSSSLATKGHPTFDGIVARTPFLEKNAEFVSKFLGSINQLHEEITKEELTPENDKVSAIADFVGAKPADVVTSLKGYKFPLLQDQLSVDLLGGGVQRALKHTAEFLRDQGKVSQVKNDYAPFVDSSFAKKLAPAQTTL